MFGKKTLARACAVGGLAVALAGIGAAAPALASNPSGSGSVGDSLTIPTTLTFAVNTPSITFTGSPGQGSNIAMVNWTLTTNDQSGASVSVLGTDLAGQAHPSNVIPVSDIAVWGLSQAQSGANPGVTGLAGYAPAELTESTSTTTANFTAPVTSQSESDSYAFLGQYGYTMGSGTAQFIPAEPPDTYAGTLAYLALAS